MGKSGRLSGRAGSPERAVDWESLARKMPVWGAAGALGLSAVASGGMQPQDEAPIVVFTAVFCALPAAWALATGRFRAHGFPGWQAALAAAVLIAVSALLTVSPDRTILRCAEIVAAAAVFVAIAWGEQRERARVAAAAASCGAVLVCLLGLQEYLLHASAGGADWRVFSTFFNPGFLAGYLVVTVPLTLALALGSRTRGAWLWGAAAVLQMALVALTGARAGLLALVCSLAVFVALLATAFFRAGAAGDRMMLRRAGAILLLGLVAIAVAGRPTGQRVKSGTQEGHSFQFRIYTWRATADMAMDRPLLGFGPGTYEVAYYPYSIAGYTRLAHSTWLQSAAESGIPAGVLLLLSWAALNGGAAWRALRTRDDPREALFVTAAAAAACATGVRGVFDSDWWNLPILLTAAAASGIAASFFAHDRHDLSPRCSRGAGWALGVTGAVAAVAAFLVQNGSAHIAAAGRAERENDYTSALYEWRQAARWMPWSVTARIRALGLEAASEGAAPDLERKFGVLQRLEPTNPKVPRAAADFYQSRGDAPRAAKWLARARRLDPKSPCLLLQEAEVLTELGRRSEAMERWREMLRIEDSPYGRVLALPQMIEPSYAWAHAAVGDRLAEEGKPREARRQWGQARDLLQRYLGSLKEMRSVLEAGALMDPEMEDKARDLLQQMETRPAQP